MNELTKIKQRILARIEKYIADMELEEGLTFDEKTILDSVKEIINEEFGTVALDTLPRFLLHEDGRIEQVKTSDEKFTDEEMKKFQKYIDEYMGITAEVKQKLYKETIKVTDIICKLANNFGLPYSMAKDMFIESMEEVKKSQTNTAKWVIAGVGVDCLGYRFKMYKCSNCGHIDNSHKMNKFCPECGKRMEG